MSNVSTMKSSQNITLEQFSCPNNQKFQKKLRGVDPLNKTNIYHAIKKFQWMGGVQEGKHNRTSHALTPEKLSDVRARIIHRNNLSIQKLSCQTR